MAYQTSANYCSIRVFESSRPNETILEVSTWDKRIGFRPYRSSIDGDLLTISYLDARAALDGPEIWDIRRKARVA